MTGQDGVHPSEPPARARRRHLAGLPGERTILAWDRTALALLGNGALLILRDAGNTHPLRLLAALIAALLAAMCGVLARARARTLADRTYRTDLTPPTRAFLVLTAGVVMIALLELASVLRG